VPVSGPERVPAGSVFAVPNGAAGIREVRLRAEGEGWALGLVDEHGEFAFPVGVGGWAESAPDGVPIAAVGGWEGDAFRAEVLFLETPHTLGVTCAADGSATVQWLTEPLHAAGIREQRHP